MTDPIQSRVVSTREDLQATLDAIENKLNVPRRVGDLRDKAMKSYEEKVDKIMANELKKLGLITDVNDKKKLKKYYPHLASHFLGLDTHDSADYERPLEPGMVLTVEPGIYIPEEHIGIRIEDNILITKTGIKILSAFLPSTLF